MKGGFFPSSHEMATQHLTQAQVGDLFYATRKGNVPLLSRFLITGMLLVTA